VALAWWLAATGGTAGGCAARRDLGRDLRESPRSAGSTAARGNPFAGARMYVNADYTRAVARSTPPSAADGARYAAVAGTPVAVWIDAIAKTSDVARHLDAAMAEEAAGGPPVVVTFVVYDLPNRDCAARSSAGELSADGDGEARYRTEVIDRVASELRRHPSLRVAVIVEPDSLANIATNLGIPRCAASEAVYRRSVAYAVRTLAMPHVSVYLDAAHAGWLGWDGNRAKIARIYRDVLADAGGPGSIRGFATNVSNYNVVRGDDGHRLEPSDPCPDELTYVQKLAQSLAEVGIVEKGFLIDTSRNGRPGIRSKWGSWCNVKGAGLGPRPQASPAPLVDAFYWVKPPGESDGTSDPSAARYDATCASPDSAPRAPEAGRWFESYFADLVANADPPL
jgi:cellulose 1,4-beta-cellobiosidase